MNRGIPKDYHKTVMPILNKLGSSESILLMDAFRALQGNVLPKGDDPVAKKREELFLQFEKCFLEEIVETFERYVFLHAERIPFRQPN